MHLVCWNNIWQTMLIEWMDCHDSWYITCSLSFVWYNISDSGCKVYGMGLVNTSNVRMNVQFCLRYIYQICPLKAYSTCCTRFHHWMSCGAWLLNAWMEGIVCTGFPTKWFSMIWWWKSSWWRHPMEHFSRDWSFVQGIQRSPVNSPRQGQWHVLGYKTCLDTKPV